MNSLAIIHEFEYNACKLRITIPQEVQEIQNCDIFVDDYNLIFVTDTLINRFKCPRRFDIKDMKNVAISFNTTEREYTCRLPCYPEECVADKIEKGELDKKSSLKDNCTGPDLRTLFRITDSCVLTVDGQLSKIKADYRYGFAGRHRGSTKTYEHDLSYISRISKPSYLSSLRRTIRREIDETRDFSPDQYKLNFVELQIPDGHDNPMKYTVSYDCTQLTKDEEGLLHNITKKDFIIKLDAQQINIDCGLISILLAICYDIRTTSNDLTCESPWTRTVLSSVLSYFEIFENITSVVDCFLRRSLIYPLYRNYDLGQLCVEDAVEALQNGKPWIVKQLLATYNCFCQSELDRKALNKFYMKDYIRYVSNVLDNDHLHMLAMNLKNVLLDTSKAQLKLGLGEIEMELLKELIEDLHLTTINEADDDISYGSGDECSTESDADSEHETEESDAVDSGDVIEKKI